MGLLVPEKPAALWRYDNWGANPGSTVGTSVTPGASNTEGSWTQVATTGNITQDVVGFHLYVHSGASAATDKSMLLDIGVDPAGGTSYTPVISNIVCGAAPTPAQAAGGHAFFFPLRIKAGSSVAVRV